MTRNMVLTMSVLAAVVAWGGNRCTWTGLGGDGKWSTAANWQDAGGLGSVPQSGNGDTVVITGNANTTQDIADDFALTALVFSNTTAAVALGGKSLSFTAGGNAIGAVGSKGFAVSNDITLVKTSTIKGSPSPYSCSGDISFYGAITASGNTIYCALATQWVSLHFYGPVTATSVEMATNKHRYYYFHRAQHAIGKLVRYYGSANCFPEPEAFAGPVKPVISFSNTYLSGVNGNYDLVNNQTFDRIESERAVYNSNYMPEAYNICHFTSVPNEYVTMTLQATGNASTWARICGKIEENDGVCTVGEGLINLVYNPQGNYTQTFNGRPHTLSGAIVVKGGTLESASSNTFALASRLDIRSGATFASNSTEPRSLAGVKHAVLAGTAKLAVNVSSAVELFGEPQAILEMGDNAQLDFAADVTVFKCRTNGVALAAGTYDASQLPQLKGEGRLVVASEEAQPALASQLVSVGEGFVDIGLVGQSGLKAEMDMSWQTAANSTCFMGAREGEGSAMLHFLADDADAGVQIAYGAVKSYSSSPSVVHFEENQRYKCVTILTNGCQSLRTYLWDGTAFVDEPDAALKIDAATDGTVNSECNLTVFAANTAGTASLNASATCYGVKIWKSVADGWVLVRDLKPAVQDGTCGLWDACDGVFYPATGRVFVTTSATWTGGGDGCTLGDPSNWLGGLVPYGGNAKFDLSSAPVTIVNEVEGAPFFSFEAFGANELRLTGKEIVLSGAATAFSNNCPLYVSTPLTFTGNSVGILICNTGSDVTFDGEINAATGSTLRIVRATCSKSTIFNAPITVPGGNLNLPTEANSGNSPAYFNAKITCRKLALPGAKGLKKGASSIARCTGYFNAGGNDVDYVYGTGKPSRMFSGGNTFSSKTVWFASDSSLSTSFGGLDYAHSLTDGSVETLNRLGGDELGTLARPQMHIRSENGGEAILHLKGTANSSTTFCLLPTVSVIWEPTGVHTQKFSNRCHDTPGFIEVRGGAVASVGTNSFPKLSRLIVRSGAAFSVADTCPAVFGDEPAVNVYLESGATLNVPAASTLKVGALVVDGVPVAPGDHTSIAGVTFTGAKINVAHAPTTTEWTGAAADGNFATVGNWTAGVPSATLSGYVTKSGTYTAEIAGATTLGNLEVAAEGLATVGAAANVTVGGTLTLGSPLDGVAGTYRQTAGTLSATASGANIALRDGGTLELAGGDAVIGNALDMTGGTLVLSGTSQLDYTPESAVFGAGTLRLGSGATLRITGNLNASPDAKLVVDVTGWDGQKSRTLAMFGGTTAAFAEGNVEIVGELPGNAELSISETQIRLVVRKGTIMFLW